MKRKESKLPIVLALLVLGYFVFWAINYVRRNQTNPPATAPIADMQRPANINTAPISAPVPVAQVAPPPVPVTSPAAPVATAATTPGDADPDPDTTTTGPPASEPVNRKMYGLTRDATNRH